MEDLGLLIPILGIVLPIGGLTIIISLAIYARIRKNRLHHEERMEMIRTGKVLPPDIEMPRPRSTAFFWGVVFAGFGAGLQIMQGFGFIADLFQGRLFRHHDPGDYFAGFIFLGIGIALIWYHNYQKKQGITNGTKIPIEPQKKEDTHVQQQ